MSFGFKGLIRSKLEYASVIWDELTLTNSNKIENIQRKFVNLCFFGVLRNYDLILSHLHFRTLYSALFNLLQELVHHTRPELDDISRALLALHLRLASEFLADDWALLDRITFEKASHVVVGDKARQCGKFQKLH
jgi:hypothetical protein